MNDAACPNALLLLASGPQRRTALAALASRGIRGELAGDADDALGRLPRRAWHVAVLDDAAGAEETLDLIERLALLAPELPVMLLAGEASVEYAVEATRRGCGAFCPQPADETAVAEALDRLAPNHRVHLAAAEEADARDLYRIAGRSEKLRKVLELARRVAGSSLPVLVCGESGTGKELISYLIHRHSRRCGGPYERVNCAALSESLLESELFGHEQGAFTGACRRHEGRFERAHGGTLLLDEISETGAKLQAQLLRVLEGQDFQRVGGSETVSANVRLISTTNRDLPAEVEAGRFRRDLYYRISGVRIVVPPLRQRVEDLPDLVWHFVNCYAGEVRRGIIELDPQMMQVFANCPWPGNVRQLRNAVRSALVLGTGPTLSLDDTPDTLAELTAHGPADRDCDLPDLSLQELERQAIGEALRKTKSHQARAARLLGITDRTLREKLRRYRQEGQTLSVGESR